MKGLEQIKADETALAKSRAVPRKLSDRRLARERDEILTEIEQATDAMPLAQARAFIAELIDDLNLKIDVIDNGEVD